MPWNNMEYTNAEADSFFTMTSKQKVFAGYKGCQPLVVDNIHSHIISQPDIFFFVLQQLTEPKSS